MQFAEILCLKQSRSPLDKVRFLFNTRALPLTRGSSQRRWMTVPGDNTLKIDNYGFTKMIISPLIKKNGINRTPTPNC